MSNRVRSVDLRNPFHPTLEGMCELLLIRHGEQQYSDGISMGDAVDAPLSDLGQRQAAAVAERLADAAIDAVYSSTMQRARDTGAAVGEQHGLAPVELVELREIELWRNFPQDKGLLDVLSKDELAGIHRQHNETRRWDAYPYTEPREEFRARIVQALEAIVDRHQGERVVVACHGGVINAALAHALRSDLDVLVSVHHTSITTVRAADTRRAVISVNDFTHVLSLQDAVNPLNLH